MLHGVTLLDSLGLVLEWQAAIMLTRNTTPLSQINVLRPTYCRRSPERCHGKVPVCEATQKSQIHLEAASDKLHTNRREWVQYSRSSAKSDLAFDQFSASCQKQTMTSTKLKNACRSRACHTRRLRNLSGKKTHCSLSWSTSGHKSCLSRLTLSSLDPASLELVLLTLFSTSVKL
jgi:hypothetical protein